MQISKCYVGLVASVESEKKSDSSIKCKRLRRERFYPSLHEIKYDIWSVMFSLSGDFKSKL